MGREASLREARFEGNLEKKIGSPHAQRETTFSRDEVGNRIYRSRGALRVVRITKIRQNEEGGGEEEVEKKEGGARSPLHVAQPLHSSTVGSQRGLKFPRSMRGIASYFLFRRAVGGRGPEGSRRGESLPFFFFLSSTLSKSHRRRGTGR